MSTGTGNATKKRKPRYDRIIIVVIPLIIFFVLFRFISGSDNENTKKSPPDKSSDESSDSILTANGRIEFEKIYFNHESIYKGNLILVDDKHEYVFPSESESELVNIDEIKNDYYKIKSADIRMNQTAIKSFNGMLSGYYLETADKSIMLLSAFITKAHQDLMFNQALENGVSLSKGGFSEHQTGLAVDIEAFPEGSSPTEAGTTGAFSWLTDNCTKYGFIQRYPDTKNSITKTSDHENHFRYVGVPHAYYMTENDLTLEEYLDELKKYTFGEKSLSFSCYSKQYEIYYIKAKSDINDVYVPRTNSYTISGNNIDGFIITVEK